MPKNNAKKSESPITTSVKYFVSFAAGQLTCLISRKVSLKKDLSFEIMPILFEGS
jgi:hypothetical protein